MEYKIGDRIKDEKRNLTITAKSRINGRLSYKYKCNTCGYDCGESFKDGKFQNEYWILGNHLCHNKVGCACCKGRAVVDGINNVGHTAPEVARFIKDDKDKLKYTKTSKQKIDFECPICHSVFNKSIGNVYYEGFSCPFCSGNMSLGEKIIYWLLTYVNANFIREYSSGSSTWTGNYRYDFYVNSNIIIEVMGIQHYKQTFINANRSLEEEQQNDLNKEQLAKENGIENYIIINASKTDFDFIKNNILNSKIAELFNLEEIDWDFIREKSLYTSIIKDICDDWNNLDMTSGELKDKYHLSYDVIQRYLKLGNKLNWCNYDTKNYRRRNIYKNDTVNTSKPIKCIENNTYFKSTGLCVRKSIEVFGIQLNESSIRSVLQGKYSHHRNYHFEYIEKQEFNNAIASGLECYGNPYKL